MGGNGNGGITPGAGGSLTTAPLGAPLEIQPGTTPPDVAGAPLGSDGTGAAGVLVPEEVLVRV